MKNNNPLGLFDDHFKYEKFIDMTSLKLLFEILNCRRLISPKILLFTSLYIITIPLLAQHRENIFTSSLGISIIPSTNDSYFYNHSFENSMSYYFSLNYQMFHKNIPVYIEIEPIIRYSNTRFEKSNPDQVQLDNGQFVDLYTVNNSAKASFVDLLFMVNCGYDKGNIGFDIGVGLGNAWYNIDKHVTDLKIDYLNDPKYLLNVDEIKNYFNESISLSELKSEGVWAFQCGLKLPLSKYLGFKSNKLNIGLRFLTIIGKKYAQTITFYQYYGNPQRTYRMGSTSLIFSINYDFN